LLIGPLCWLCEELALADGDPLLALELLPDAFAPLPPLLPLQAVAPSARASTATDAAPTRPAPPLPRAPGPRPLVPSPVATDRNPSSRRTPQPPSFSTPDAASDRRLPGS
jgi:hypothetical protein